MQINPMSFRELKWLFGSIVAIIFAAARCVSWWRPSYPADMACRVAGKTVYPLGDLGSPLSSAPARQPMSEMTAQKHRYAERPALVMSEASKIGRAPLVDLDAPACRQSPAQVRLPLVTRGGRFTAATFRS